jgi:hypothetical protein
MQALREPVFRYEPEHTEETVATLKQQYIFIPSHVGFFVKKMFMHTHNPLRM